MKEFLHASWLGTRRTATGAAADAIERLVVSLGSVATGISGAAYAVADSDEVMRRLVPNRRRLNGPQFDPAPAWVLLTELESLQDSLSFDDALRARLGEDSALHGLVSAARAVYREITTTVGPAGNEHAPLADAIQFGRFSMPSPDEDWEIAKWYQEKRLASFQVMPGAVRCRRYVVASGGYGRFAVLYEFRSDDDRLAYFEFLLQARDRDADADAVSPVPRTVHEPLSSCAGSLVARFA